MLTNIYLRWQRSHGDPGLARPQLMRQSQVWPSFSTSHRPGQ
jgi:hypothetical protein